MIFFIMAECIKNALLHCFIYLFFKAFIVHAARWHNFIMNMGLPNMYFSATGDRGWGSTPLTAIVDS